MFIQEAEAISATPLQLAGAFGFGMLIGWYVYYINRYRKGDVQFSDLSTVIGILGGGAVLALFPAKTDLFGAYGVGLAVGFFSYFAFLMLWVRISKNFNVDWFLDGRRKKLADDEMTTGARRTVTAMEARDENQSDFE
ncbi:MAG: hypothetical protein HF973_07655 [Chloroflexi bacterium]|nr:hypothetical protein [Chloroflexota bacterium]